ncbi:MAG: T9SS type A sorting domain-containing protein, partial [Cyclobacteriaceae bacterium]|nr:T9SS type A sorting domain-containing protein [Cyclobacteriaceae bacterium HetDA_MAG_MS6]
GNNSAQSSALNVTTTPGGGGGTVYNRVRKVGTNFWYVYSDNPNDGQSGFTHNAVFRGQNLNFATETNPWNSAFLERIKIYQAFRYMDWNCTNYQPSGSNITPITVWSHRTLKGDPFQNTPTSGEVKVNQGGGRNTCGVAYEWMVDLCNRNQSDMWIPIPHATIDPDDFPNGDDFQNEYVHKLAILLKHGVDMQNTNIKNLVGGKNNLDDLATKSKQWFLSNGGVQTGDALDSNLKIYVEYSNELWLRGQNSYTNQKAAQLGLPGGSSSGYYRYGAWADIRIWKAFQDVFGDISRIVRVTGHTTRDQQGARNHFNEIINNSTYNPWNLQPDAWQFNSYVNPGTYSPKPHTLGNASNVEAKWAEEIQVKNSGTTTPLRNIMQGFGVNQILAYEGGQHFEGSAGDFARNPRARDMMFKWAKDFTTSQTFDLNFHYAHEGKWAANGAGGINSWGAMDNSLQNINQAYKYLGIKDWVDGQNSAGRLEGDVVLEETLKEVKYESGIIAYPNPTSDGRIFISTEKPLEQGSFVVYGFDGRLVKRGAIKDTELIIQLDQTGLFLVEIKDAGSVVQRLKVISK